VKVVSRHTGPRSIPATLRIRYEDFAREPQRTVRRIAALVGEVPAELPLSFDSTRRMQLSIRRPASESVHDRGLEVRPDEWVHLMRRTIVCWSLP
jgi:hypothetical protein